MKEKIGGVLLNLDFYSGQDLYSDGETEEELLDIVQKYATEEFPRVILEKKSWPILYHLSPIRANCIEWVDIGSHQEILEVGSGCGAITGVLAGKAKKVTCVELSKRRSMINAIRNQNCDNIDIFVGNFEDIETALQRFDVILLIGVLEYAKSYINTSFPYENFLGMMKKHLKPEGRLIVAIENRLGMKYWAGCREDHTGKLFQSIEGYSKDSHVKTFSRNELIKLFRDTGFYRMIFYYPYPDYKFPMAIYSDNRLPLKGELTRNNRNFDMERYILFDEGKSFDTVIEAGLFKEFSNSFLVISQEGEQE